MDLKTILPLALQLSLWLTVFGFGLRATRADLFYLVERPRLLARTFISMFIIMPLGTFAILKVLGISGGVAACLMGLAVSPVPPILPRKEMKAGGSHGYVIGLMATMSLLAVAVVPVAVVLFASWFERSVAGPGIAVARLVGVSILLPLVLGVLVVRFLPGIASKLEPVIVKVSMLLLAATVVLLLIGSFKTMLAAIGDWTLVAAFLFVVLGLVSGHVLGGPEKEHRIVLALSTATRHPGMAMMLAKANFPEAPLAGPILLYLAVSILGAIPYIRRMSRSGKGG